MAYSLAKRNQNPLLEASPYFDADDSEDDDFGSFAESNPHVGFYIAGGVLALGIVGAGAWWWFSSGTEVEAEVTGKGGKKKTKAGMTAQQAGAIILKKIGAEYSGVTVASIEKDVPEPGEWFAQLVLGSNSAGEAILHADGTVEHDV